MRKRPTRHGCSDAESRIDNATGELDRVEFIVNRNFEKGSRRILEKLREALNREISQKRVAFGIQNLPAARIHEINGTDPERR